MISTSNLQYAKALIKAGIARELVIKITSISGYQYSQIRKELAA